MVVILGVLVLVTRSSLDIIGYDNITVRASIVMRENVEPETASITAVALLIDSPVTVTVTVSVSVQCRARTAPLTGAAGHDARALHRHHRLQRLSRPH